MKIEYEVRDKKYISLMDKVFKCSLEYYLNNKQEGLDVIRTEDGKFFIINLKKEKAILTFVNEKGFE